MIQRKKGAVITILAACMSVLAATSSILSGSLGIYRHYVIGVVLITEVLLVVALIRMKRGARHA